MPATAPCTITLGQRAQRNGHPGFVVWLTGLPASGKTTIAAELERQLFHQGKQVFVLDGDKLRRRLCLDLGFTPDDRRENIRRAGEVAALFAEAGMICIAAFISPYQKDREQARHLVRAGGFVEVYVNAPLEVCEQRDPKGLYARARAGQVADLTGIHAPYEAPGQPEVEVRTDRLPVSESVTRILDHLRHCMQGSVLE